VKATTGLLLVAVLAGCGTSLTDAQRLWCQSHDMTQNDSAVAIGFASPSDDTVLEAAETLGIEVPAEIAQANAVFGLLNAGADTSVANDIPEGWPDVLDAWRTTSDYARACVAAFEAR